MEIEPRIIALALYLGPDVLMPVASAIAAIAGFLLMFWQRTVLFFRRIAQSIRDAFGRKT